MDLVPCWNSGTADTEWHRDGTSPKDPTPPTHATGLHTNLLIHHKKPNCWGAQDTLKGDKSAIKPVLHTSSLSNYWYLGPELFLNERVKAGCFTIRWCINKPRMTNKINKSLSESLSMALKCSCIDIIKMQLFQLLTAPWNVQRWKRNGIKDPNPVAPETLIFIFFPSGFTVGESI